MYGKTTNIYLLVTFCTDTRFILVRVECPYVQFMAAACVISTEKFVVGVTNGRERERSQVSDGKVEWVLRAWSLLSYV